MPHVELPQAEFKVVMLGDTNAGKTSLVLRFAEGYYREKTASTVGAFFITKRIQTPSGITCKIQIWDTAGQEQFRAMAPMYYRTAAAAIVCYDVASRRSFDVLREWLDELRCNLGGTSIVIAIAATKADLRARAEVARTEAEALARELDAIYVDTSAKENIGVDKVFRKVAERVLFVRERARVGMALAPPESNKKGDHPATRRQRSNDEEDKNSFEEVLDEGVNMGRKSLLCDAVSCSNETSSVL
eukprot:CAMPEP_0113309036 /NCGR_PEP_ID=MMETSP0010_2-20120614/7245_1 /TAXON_ID=216773 ORGANISM="Corethron hystrix, Strain 308" /NCGR_SAMPLE_ID=MMETSP0010_2 /ASSEMBLY_ACC=CAM_ASM_000155 /LENGTH=244 /DNA_ID=CAMNT_0000164217 /DNA_START=123 /DNA_END=858 /DNA_ORIENTATION=+ /assembly_acc=CAM_ASM_000155